MEVLEPESLIIFSAIMAPVVIAAIDLVILAVSTFSQYVIWPWIKKNLLGV